MVCVTHRIETVGVGDNDECTRCPGWLGTLVEALGMRTDGFRNTLFSRWVY